MVPSDIVAVTELFVKDILALLRLAGVVACERGAALSSFKYIEACPSTKPSIGPSDIKSVTVIV